MYAFNFFQKNLSDLKLSNGTVCKLHTAVIYIYLLCFFALCGTYGIEVV